jgi:hypothetical protein
VRTAQEARGERRVQKIWRERDISGLWQNLFSGCGSILGSDIHPLTFMEHSCVLIIYSSFLCNEVDICFYNLHQKNLNQKDNSLKQLLWKQRKFRSQLYHLFTCDLRSTSLYLNYVYNRDNNRIYRRNIMKTKWDIMPQSG